jgi:uncharacterized membrane protein
MRSTALLPIGALLILAAPPARGANTFTGLGDLPGGGFYTQVWDVSGNGKVAVGSASAPGTASGLRAFRWENGVMEALVAPIASFSAAVAVSADGGVVVGNNWRWDHGVSTRVLGPTGQMVLETTDVSADGSVMVGDAPPDFRSQNGVAQTIAPPPGYFTRGSPVVSGDGSVIAGTADDGANSLIAFRWQNGVTTLLPTQPAEFPNPFINGISGNGAVIVGQSNSQPCFWKAGAIQELPLLPTFSFGEAFDASADGAVIVGTSDAWDPVQMRVVGHATLWVRGQAHSLGTLLANQGIDLTGWQVEQIQAVSNDGTTMVGQGINPSGQTEGWIAHLDRCDNGIDDDGDGAVDWDGAGVGAPDPQCGGDPEHASERSAGGCGLGAELTIVLIALAGRRRFLR